MNSARNAMAMTSHRRGDCEGSVNASERTTANLIRILVVDDDLPTRQATMDGLRSRGYQVAGAGDGLQALHHLQRAQFAVVVTDIQMPRMDGVALLREIGRKGYARVVVQTTLMDAPLRELLCQAGAFDVLVKGGPQEELFRAVEAAVRGRGASARTCSGEGGGGSGKAER